MWGRSPSVSRPSQWHLSYWFPQRRETGTIRPFRHVAVAVDFSTGSNRAVEQALASESGDRVTLLHVVPGFSSGVPPHLYRYGIAEYQDQLMQDAQRRLHHIGNSRRRNGERSPGEHLSATRRLNTM